MKSNVVKLLALLSAFFLSPVAGAVTYSYDDLNRLTSVTFDSGPPQIYSYDPAGNLLSMTTTGVVVSNFTLMVGLSDSGSGTVSGSGISCGSTCSASLASGASVTLTASAASGSTFAGWSGDCSGVSTCVLTMSADRSITAIFTANTSGGGTGGTGGGGTPPTLNIPLTLAQGWNLLGNSLNQTITVATVFGDPTQVTTVWKWGISPAGWQFYAPSMDATALQTYAANKGYGVLSAINPGEGYWVNAKAPATLSTQSGTAFNLTSGNLVTGWNLAATGNDVTPSAFNLALSASPPAPGTMPINLTTLWAWDNASSRWYFYAPSLESGGTLAAYITGKGYLDFTQNGKSLGNGTGFWVNRP